MLHTHSIKLMKLKIEEEKLQLDELKGGIDQSTFDLDPLKDNEELK